MNVRKHFRMSSSCIDLLVMDITTNRIVSRDAFFDYCVNARLQRLCEEYDEKLDKIVTFVILHCNYANLPIDTLSRLILSLSKITNALSRGIISLIK